MSVPDSTCWTVIQAAAAGSADDRAEFARRYAPVARAYLAARWRASPCTAELDDAVQEVFVECFRPGGILDRADRDRGFRAFFYGALRNVALRVETSRARRREHPAAPDAPLEGVPDDEESQSRAFDRAWARALLREAAARMEERARAAGAEACRRVELLKLRFYDGLPVRDIAARWQTEPATLHRQYARARQEFREALLEVVAFHHPGSPAEVEQESVKLLALLG
jgi:RNA polymerase sigma-70 factor (ECF subfamily)